MTPEPSLPLNSAALSPDASQAPAPGPGPGWELVMISDNGDGYECGGEPQGLMWAPAGAGQTLRALTAQFAALTGLGLHDPRGSFGDDDDEAVLERAARIDALLGTQLHAAARRGVSSSDTPAALLCLWLERAHGWQPAAHQRWQIGRGGHEASLGPVHGPTAPRQEPQPYRLSPTRWPAAWALAEAGVSAGEAELADLARLGWIQEDAPGQWSCTGREAEDVHQTLRARARLFPAGLGVGALEPGTHLDLHVQMPSDSLPAPGRRPRVVDGWLSLSVTAEQAVDATLQGPWRPGLALIPEALRPRTRLGQALGQALSRSDEGPLRVLAEQIDPGCRANHGLESNTDVHGDHGALLDRPAHEESPRSARAGLLVRHLIQNLPLAPQGQASAHQADLDTLAAVPEAAPLFYEAGLITPAQLRALRPELMTRLDPDLNPDLDPPGTPSSPTGGPA